MKTSPLSERFHSKFNIAYVRDKGFATLGQEIALFYEYELLSIRDEVEGKKKHPSDYSLPENTLNNSYSFRGGFNAGTNHAIDTTLSIINTHLYGEKE